MSDPTDVQLGIIRDTWSAGGGYVVLLRVVIPCSLVGFYQCFGGTRCPLFNVKVKGKHIPDYALLVMTQKAVI